MTVRVGVWLGAGTAIADPYPCRCPFVDEWTHRMGRCPCWGRTDVATMAPGCCGWAHPILLTRQYAGS